MVAEVETPSSVKRLTTNPSTDRSTIGSQGIPQMRDSRNGGSPIAGWFVVENSKPKWMTWGYIQMETSISKISLLQPPNTVKIVGNPGNME